MDPFTILVISPPGAGKTYFFTNKMQRQLEQRGHNVSYYDGSSDELVNVALVTSLSERVNSGQTDGRAVLVVDEFHMLSGALPALLLMQEIRR